MWCGRVGGGGVKGMGGGVKLIGDGREMDGFGRGERWEGGREEEKKESGVG